MKGSNYLRGESPEKRPNATFARFWQAQPMLARWSYAAAAIGALLSIHDFHHPRDSFGYSTPFLGVAIVLYLLSLRGPTVSKR